MTAILEEQPGWVIDDEPMPLPFDSTVSPVERKQPATIPAVLNPLNDPRLAEVEATGETEIPSQLNPLNDPRLADVEIGTDSPMTDPRLNHDEAAPKHPGDVIDELRDYDFRAMIDPEGDNWYGRDDEAFHEILLKWGGNTSLGGAKGILQGISTYFGGPDITDVTQLKGAIERFKQQPQYVLDSSEGQEYAQYLRDRLDQAVEVRDTGFLDAMGLFVDYAVDNPSEVGPMLAHAIIDDPIAMAVGLGIYNKGKAIGLTAANAARLKKTMAILDKQGKAGKAAKVVLNNAVKISPAVVGEAIYAGEYQRMNNLMRGSPLENDVDSMRVFGGLVGAVSRGVGVGIEARRAPYLGATIRPEKGAGTVSPEAADLTSAIGGVTKGGVIKGSSENESGIHIRGLSPAERTAHTGVPERQQALPGFKTRTQVERSGQATKAKDARYQIHGEAERTKNIKEFPRISTKSGLGGDEGIGELFTKPFGSLFKLRDMERGWNVRTGMTNLAKGSGLINYDASNSFITFDLGRFLADPVKSFTDAYITPKIPNNWNREYIAAAKAIGFDTKKLNKLLDSEKAMARFALSKEKFFIQSHLKIPPRTNARKMYRVARDMYRHEVSLYDALKETGFDVSGLKRPGKFRATKPYIAEKSASVLNTYIKAPVVKAYTRRIQPAIEKAKGAYKETLEERTAVPPRIATPPHTGETAVVDKFGAVKSSTPRHATGEDKRAAWEAGIKAGGRELAHRFKGRFDDNPDQFELDLEPPAWRKGGKFSEPNFDSLKGEPQFKPKAVPYKSMKGRSFTTISRAMQLLNRNKKGALSLILGRKPAVAILHDTRGSDHIDRWLGDNDIFDREAMKLQHRIMARMPDVDKRHAAAHYMENNLKDYNNTRVRKGLKVIVLTEAERNFIDTELRPIMDEIFVWSQKHDIIPRDAAGLKQKFMEIEIPKDATPEDLIKKIEESSRGVRYRRNYFPHIGKRSYTRSFEEYLDELAETGKSAVAMKANMAYSRKFTTLLDAQEAGFPMHSDIAKVMSTYVRGIFRVHTNRQLIRNLKDVDIGDVKLIVPHDSAPADYKIFKHPVMRDGAGEYMAVHPGIENELKMIFDTSDPTVLRRLLVNVNTTLKRIAVSNSLFHAMALIFSGLYSGAINPLRPIKSVKQYKRALARMREGPMGDRIDFYLQHGLKVGGIDDVNSEALIHLMEAASASVDRLVPPGHFGRVIKVAPNSVKWLTEKIDSITWDHVMSAGKIIAMDKAYARLVRADIRNHVKTGAPLTPERVLGEQAATYVNDAFGGLDWRRLARNVEQKVARKFAAQVTGHGKESKTGGVRGKIGSYLSGKHGRESMQLAVFAPDWTTANWRIATKGLPGASTSRAMANLYRTYMLRAIVIHLMMSEGLQQITTDTSIFDNYGTRGWLRPHIGDGIHIEISKQLTETYRAGTYFAQGDLSPIGHKSSSMFHLLHNIVEGKSSADVLEEALTPISMRSYIREHEKGAGHWGALGIIGFPARFYDKPWERPRPEDEALREAIRKAKN